MLNVNQINAINHIEGPCLTIAGPGAGKTTVLVERILNLINYGVNPERILVITFTKDAALEMKNRYLKKVNQNHQSVNFGTFHSIFYHILLNSPNYREYELLNDKKKKELYLECAKIVGLKVDSPGIIPAIEKEISYYLNSSGARLLDKETILSKEEFFSFFNVLEKRKEAHKLLDFDDMLVKTRDLLSCDSDFRLIWQNRFDYYLVDEFQDINGVQFDVLKLLLMEKSPQNIFAVGDDDQSIYGFRGSDPSYMLKFPEVFSGTKTIVLDTNYRSDKAIVNKSKKMISKNENRYEKDYVAASKNTGSIRIERFKDNYQEARFILNFLKDNDNGFKTGILYRNRSRAGLCYSLLKKHKILASLKEDFFDFKNSQVCKDILAYLKILSGDFKRRDILRVMNKPERSLNRGGLFKEKISLDSWQKYYPKGTFGYEKIGEFIKNIDLAKNLSCYSQINFIKKGMGYDEYLKSYAKSNEKDLEELLNISEFILDYSRDFTFLKDFIKDLEKEEKKQEKEKKEDKNISFYTFHGSKGLEFDRVIILDALEGITPSKNATDEKKICEERRMFYVALTRAKKEIIICVPQKIGDKEYYPSRFISEMEFDL